MMTPKRNHWNGEVINKKSQFFKEPRQNCNLLGTETFIKKNNNTKNNKYIFHLKFQLF